MLPHPGGSVAMGEERVYRPDILVRRLTADDWQQARAARLAALADAPYAFSSTLAKEQAYADEVWRSRAGSGRTFGAFDGAGLIGLATGIPANELDQPAKPSGGMPGAGADGDQLGSAQPDWHLVGMWVAPSYRGQRVADRLVEAVCEQARQADAVTVTLWVTEMNDRAIAFYRRRGFVPTGMRQLVRRHEPGHWEMELARRLR
jgi:ribosomal protein S18 acetylase RimI-like enzyme